MHIEHIAIWARDIERLKAFYEKYLHATSNAKYVNAGKQFESYFLSFEGGARLELMYSPGIQGLQNSEDVQFTGYVHLAISVGSKEKVEALTSQLQQDGYRILDGPRWTGDGYYESSFFDPDGNRVEITV